MKSLLAQSEQPGGVRDAASLCIEMPLNRRSVAVVDAGGLCLAPGEQAIVPVAWDRAVPSDDFWCEESS